VSNTPVKVTVRNGTVLIQFPARLLRTRPAAGERRPGRTDWRILRQVRGMWKRRKQDALAYQRDARAEWN